MKGFGELLRFQLWRNLRAISTWVYVLCLALAALIQTAFEVGAFSEGRDYGSLALANSPNQIAMRTAAYGIVSVFVIAAVSASAATADTVSGMRALVFQRPVGTRAWFFARYLASLITLAFILLSITFGFAAATFLPNASPDRMMHATLASYLWPYAVFLLCNAVVLGAICFTVAALTQRGFLAQVTAVVAFLGTQLARGMAAKLEAEDVFSLADPFGRSALEATTKYWTAAERNSLALQLSGRLLENRLLWLIIGAGALLLGAWRFQPRIAEASKRTREKVTAAIATTTRAALERRAISLLEIGKLALDDVRQVMRGPVFLVLSIAGLLLFAIRVRDIGLMLDTRTYPVTYEMLEVLQQSFGFPLLILVVLLAGELIWRERDAGLQQVVGALPVASSVFALRSALAILFLTLAIHLAQVPIGVITQAALGYFDFELGHYLQELFLIGAPGYLVIGLFALTAQALIQNKYAAHFVVVGIYVASGFLPKLGLEHGLFQIGHMPNYTYSAFNGYGHYVPSLAAYSLHWFLLSVAALAAVSGRWLLGRRERSRPARIVAAGFTALACVTGAIILYNTTVLHPFYGEFAHDERTAAYEKTYREKWQHAPMPKITATHIAANIEPSQRRLHVTATQKLEAEAEIGTLFLNKPSDATIELLEIAGRSTSYTIDEPKTVVLLNIVPPLHAGDVVELRATLSYAETGFREYDSSLTTALVENGTFLNGGMVLTIGYQSDAEMELDDRRKRHGLSMRPRALDLDDPAGRARNTLTPYADFGDLSFDVRTEAGQTPLAPGKPGKIIPNALPFFTILSGRYTLAHAKHGGVDIEIFHHPSHTYNVASMEKAVRDSLDLFGKAYGPYQSDVLRIVEFPRYRSFAQSFTTTVPFSEAIGFIAKVDPEDDADLDYPYYITAHEVAHQWWGHQVDAAHVQGETFLIESLAEYSALMVLKKSHGDKAMFRYLKHELDGYLRGRARTRFPEKPLMRVEGDGYIRYQKGSLALYALMDTIGEEAMDRALGRYAAAWRYKGPPYPTSRDLIAELRAETPEDKRFLIEDLFETITLFDLRCDEATAVATSDGGDVTLRISASKKRADGLGAEVDTPLAQDLDVGLVDTHGVAVLLEKRPIKAGEQTVSLHLGPELWAKRATLRAGIDPLHKQIDRVANDNLQPVK